MEKLLSKHSKIFVIAWLLISLILVGVICTFNRITFTLNATPATLNSPVILSDGINKIVFDPNQTNRITLNLSKNPVNPLDLIESVDTPMPLQIVNIKASTIFGGVTFNQRTAIGTLLQEFTKISFYLPVSVNKSPPAINIPLTCAYVVLAVFIALILVIIGIKIVSLIIAKMPEFEDRKISPKVFYLINGIIFIGVAAISVWATFCGILFGDDGFFLIMAKFPGDVLAATTGTYYILTHQLWNLALHQVILFRNITLILNFFSIGFLTYSVMCLFRHLGNVANFRLQAIIVFIVLYIASSFQYVHHITPDYNNLSRYIVFGQISLLLLMLFKDNLKQKEKYLLIFILGITTGISLFAKFPEFICSVLLIIILLKLVKARYWIAIPLFAGGIAATLFIYFSTLQSVHDFISVLKNGLDYSSIFGGHSVGIILYNNFRDIAIVLLRLIGVILVYHYCRQYLFKRCHPLSVRLFFIIAISLAAVIHSLYYRELIGYFTYISKSLIFILAILIYENIRQDKFVLKLNLVCTGLLIFLYIASVGTDTQILYHIMFNISILYIAILLQLLGSKDFCLIATALAVMASVMVIKGLIVNSKQYNNLFTQNVEYKFSGSKVYLNSEAVSDLNQIRQALLSCGYHEGDFISGFYTTPQLVFAVGGRSPVTPWYSFGKVYKERTSVPANLFIMSRIKPEIKQKLFLLINKDMYHNGLGFGVVPDYNYCAEVKLSGVNTMIGGTNYAIYHHK